MYYFVTVMARATREIIATYVHSFEEDAHEAAQQAQETARRIGTGEGYAVFITSGDPLS